MGEETKGKVKNLLAEDDELVSRSRAGDNDAEEQLLKKYGDIVKRETRVVFLVGGDNLDGVERDDLIQEGMIGLMKAVRNYQPGGEAAFRTFATTCVQNQILSAIRAANRKKHLPMKNYISIYPDSEHPDEPDPDEYLKELWMEGPETVLIRKEDAENRLRSIEEILSAFEWAVVKDYLEGYGSAEIAVRLGRPQRSVENALTRSRKKIWDSLKKRDKKDPDHNE